MKPRARSRHANSPESRSAPAAKHMHGCAAAGCEEQVTLETLLCARHYRSLGQTARLELSEAWRRRHEGPEARAHYFATRQAAVELASKLGAPGRMLPWRQDPRPGSAV